MESSEEKFGKSVILESRIDVLTRQNNELKNKVVSLTESLAVEAASNKTLRRLLHSLELKLEPFANPREASGKG